MAMAGEVQFTNENERAFALFRKGCSHCAQLPEELAAVGPKDTVVAFLSRVAARRTAGRQLQELCKILVKVADWQSLLAGAPPQLLDVLSADPAFLTALDSWRTPSGTPAPSHEARVFLREATSRRFLSVVAECAAAAAVVEHCAMTAAASSLFVCYAKDTGKLAADLDDEGADEAWDVDGRTYGGPAAGSVLGFAHEGVPALGCFLACKRSRRRTFRDAFTGGGDSELRCSSRSFGRHEEFRWGADSTIQHVPSSLWLFVDPDRPEAIAMHAAQKSIWEALPAL